MRTLWIPLTLTTLALTVASSAAAQGATKPLKIGLVQINLQAKFFNDINAGAQAAAKKANIDLQIINANNDPTAQVNAIETLTQRKVDGIIIVAIDVKGVVPALQEAAKAGINVVAVDAEIKDPSVKSFIGVDNARAAAVFGAFVSSYVTKSMGGKANLGTVGALNSYIQNLRRDNFLKALSTVSGVKVGSTVDGQNVQERALTAAENLITSNSSLNLIYATGEPALIGAIAATESQNAQGRVKVFGWDLSPQAVKAIDTGFLVGVVQQNPYQEGVEAVNALIKLSKKQSVKAFINVPVTIVTKANIEKYRAAFK